MTPHAGPARDPIRIRLMDTARHEAERARHGYVGCEHLLLALLADKDPTARDILADHSIGLAAARVAVADVISSGRGDGPRWHPADLLATLGVDLPAIQRQMRAGFGPHAIDELYRSPVGRRLSLGAAVRAENGTRTEKGTLRSPAFRPVRRQRACPAGAARRRQRRTRRGPRRARLEP